MNAVQVFIVACTPLAVAGLWIWCGRLERRVEKLEQLLNKWQAIAGRKP